MSTFSDAVKNPRRELCAVAVNFSSDEFTDRDRSILSNPKIADDTIVKALDRKGIQTSEAAIKLHRQGQCKCHPAETPQLKSDAPKRQLDRYAAKKAERTARHRRTPETAVQRTLSI